VARLEHEEPLEDPHLRGGEPDAVRVVHQDRHPLDEPLQLVVERLDRLRGHTQRRVGELADLGEREAAPRLLLAVELLVDADLSFGLCHAAGTLPRMDPREIKEIMSQGAIRPETARDRAERRTLAEDLAGSPIKGQPLTPRLRNFRPDPANALVAVGGPTAWMRRLREIEDATEDHERRLADAWRELALECSGDEF